MPRRIFALQPLAAAALAAALGAAQAQPASLEPAAPGQAAPEKPKVTPQELLAKFRAGDLVFDCRVVCFLAYSQNKTEWRSLHRERAWRELVLSVAQTGFLSDLSYFMLAEAAKGMGLPAVARTYYQRAVDAEADGNGCAGFLNACEGFAVKRLSLRAVQQEEGGAAAAAAAAPAAAPAAAAPASAPAAAAAPAAVEPMAAPQPASRRNPFAAAITGPSEPPAAPRVQSRVQGASNVVTEGPVPFGTAPAQAPAQTQASTGPSQNELDEAQQQSETLEDFRKGELAFECKFTCAFSYTLYRPKWRQLYEDKNWEELVLLVAKTGYHVDLAYYMLAEAAKNLKLPQAARLYYERAVEAGKTNDDCEGGTISTCEGFAVQDLSYAALGLQRPPKPAPAPPGPPQSVQSQ